MMAKAANRLRSKSTEEIDCSSLTDAQEAIIREVISRVMDKWSLWALTELTTKGPLRFSQILKLVEGVSQKSLTVTLRNLERDGLVTRTVIAQVPIRVDYAATAMGREIAGQIHPLWMYVATHLEQVDAARRAFNDRREHA